jgi:hypothetical protein
MTIEDLKNIIENNGFEIYADDTDWEISQYTPEGEDWNESFEVNNSVDTFISELRSRVENFDIDDEVEPYISMRGTRGVPSSISDLMEDAKWKKETLENLLANITTTQDNENSVELESKKLDEGNTNVIPRNWKKIVYKSKVDTNAGPAGSTFEVFKDEFDRNTQRNVETGDLYYVFLDNIRNPELAEIISIEKADNKEVKTESDETPDESFYEKIDRAVINTLGLEFVFVNPENNNSIAHGYFIDDDTAYKVRNDGIEITPENYREYASETLEGTDEVYEYDTWEDFFYDYIKDQIINDLEDGVYYDASGNWDFEITPDELQKAGIDMEEYLEENKEIKTEEVSDEAYDVAEKIATEIEKQGRMNFEDVDNLIAKYTGKSIETIQEEELNTTIYGILNYKGISQNLSSGDFYTSKYAEEHPEVLEESKLEETKFDVKKAAREVYKRANEVYQKNFVDTTELDKVMKEYFADKYSSEQLETLHDYFVEQKLAFFEPELFGEDDEELNETKKVKTESENVIAQNVEKLRDGTSRVELKSGNHKMWFKVKSVGKNGVIDYDYDFDANNSNEDEDYFNSSVDVNDVEEAILSALEENKEIKTESDTEFANTNIEKGLRDEVKYWIQSLIDERQTDATGQRALDLIDDEKAIQDIVDDLLMDDDIWELIHIKIEQYGDLRDRYER